MTLDSKTQKRIEKLTDDLAKRMVPLMYQRAIERANKLITATMNGHGTSGQRAAETRRIKTAIAAKRNPKQIEGVMKKVVEFVHSNPGSSVEAIGSGTSLKTRHLQLPIRRLLEAKILRKTGAKRATKYFPGKNGK